ncbi:tautomerase family protein [Methylopila sp. M107]|uniref:tautomerase family protein n=1 Tax=Methylopila sp. M107 TaxID=1101190 RepID=UPI0003748C20|nr:tautomerase family protein [Methylopila sp. M107]
MPTYVCAAPAGLLSDAQKAEIARAITRVHSEATGAPTYFVQVVIDDSPKTRFLGGERADGQIWIRGDIRAGRPESVRENMMLAMMRAVAAIANVKDTEIWVYLNNLAPTDMVEYGHVLPRPGEEQAWFDALPAELRSYLAGLGTDGGSFTL